MDEMLIKNIKEDICIKLEADNGSDGRKLLNLAVKYYYPLSDDCRDYMELSTAILNTFGIEDTDEFMERALANTKRLLPVVVADVKNDHGLYRMLQMSQTLSDKAMMSVVTDVSYFYGAYVLLDKPTLKVLSDKLGKSLYLMPVSKHMLFACSCECADANAMLSYLVYSNSRIDACDVLTNTIYRYDSETDEVSIAVSK